MILALLAAVAGLALGYWLVSVFLSSPEPPTRDGAPHEKGPPPPEE